MRILQSVPFACFVTRFAHNSITFRSVSLRITQMPSDDAAKKQAPVPRTCLSFYFALFKSAFTEAYDAVDAYLTFAAFLVFAVALFSKELSNQLEARWQGLSRWYSLLPLIAFFLYRLMRANYRHFKSAVSQLDSTEAELRKGRDSLQQPDVALVWDWTEDQRRGKELLGLSETDKVILIHNRSADYIYNVNTQPIKLAGEMKFDDINEVGPGEKHPLRARWDGRSSETTNYVYFFGKEENEIAMSQKGWVRKKLHSSGLGDDFAKIPMVVTYESKGATWEGAFDFDYDIGDKPVFTKRGSMRLPVG
jgi:hypothetical protein